MSSSKRFLALVIGIAAALAIGSLGTFIVLSRHSEQPAPKHTFRLVQAPRRVLSLGNMLQISTPRMETYIAYVTRPDGDTYSFNIAYSPELREAQIDPVDTSAPQGYLVFDCNSPDEAVNRYLDGKYTRPPDLPLRGEADG